MISKKKSIHFKEYFHWLFIVAPMLSIAVASYWRIDRTVAEFVIIPAAILINLVIICVKSYVDASEGQSPIRTFLTDDLLPNKTGKRLSYNIEIAVIEAEESKAVFCNQLDERFKTQVTANAKRKPVAADPNLSFRPLSCVFADQQDAVDALANDLSNCRAVVVIRTKDLEKKPWVYRALDSWAYERSDVPILFTELNKDAAAELREEKFEISAIPEKYFSIPEDPKSLPWRLLQRSSERGLTWRNQATFNRLIATNFIALLIMSFLISHFLISRQSHDTEVMNANQRNEYINATNQLYQVMQTRDEYKRLIGQPNRNNLDVSYWIQYEGKPHVYVTTENDTNLMSFKNDKSSIIGCASAFHNAWAQWHGSDGIVHVRDFSRQTIDKSGCDMWIRPNRPIESIVCASYNPPPFDPTHIDPSYTVGVCVFAGPDTNMESETDANKDKDGIFVGGYLEFLKEKAKTFYEFASPLIKENRITPLTKRR